ncbi:hypothetical protein CHRY9293_03650 [Chryseobacterium potabilaquae]|uniref:Uncharacterized protein n=1 Tax=Chryseobacterium potabilaquae TaxID=2675057 RepID=A0A6N4XD12_9FLAO|nr:hypothetical protein CHRY9293_03650 [Chryseobacterium potabilaquae]
MKTNNIKPYNLGVITQALLYLFHENDNFEMIFITQKTPFKSLN